MNFIDLTMTSESKTRAMAKIIGSNLRGGEVIELVSDVGGGKTTFVRGMVKGAGSASHVSSPTFAISKAYRAPNFNIVHFDFYRLEDVELMELELEEEINDEKSVIVIEWSDAVKHILPCEKLIINIKLQADNSREFKIEYPDTLSYLLKGVN